MLCPTADHGGETYPSACPERRRAARVDPALAAVQWQAIAARLKLSGPVLLGDFSGDVYFDRALKPSERARAQTEALAAYARHPQVEEVLTSEQLRRIALPSTSPDKWTLAERARASFDPKRSGDLIVLLKPHITPIADTHSYIATHGSPWDYDRRVPIMFWRRGMAAANRDDHIETIDIMPTLAATIRIAVESTSIDRKCLPGIPGVACPSR